MPITSNASNADVSSPGEYSVSDSEVEGTDYLLTSTMRFDDAFFQILGKSLFLFFFNIFSSKRSLINSQLSLHQDTETLKNVELTDNF